ncbi:MAG TPA: hypothetical protein PLD62_02115 [Candidatus Cloacimonadota bacterium]|nr:hypothetical protein [Candidatus Cloacimonadota bacterium]
MKKESVFLRQNSLLKLLYVIVFTFIITIADLSYFLILFTFHLLLIGSLRFSILPKWLFTIIKILPFYISLLLLSIIFDSPFFPQLLLLGRLSLILLLSVFLIESSSIENFVADTAGWKQRWHDLRFFFLAVIYFIPVFIGKFKRLKKGKLSINILKECFDEICRIETETEQSLRISHRTFDITANLLLILPLLFCIFITIIYRKVLCVI